MATAGFQVLDANGNVFLDGSELTSRYHSKYDFIAPQTTDLLISVPGLVPGKFFVTTLDIQAGFPIIEQDRIRIKRAFGGGGAQSTVYVFTI